MNSNIIFVILLTFLSGSSWSKTAPPAPYVGTTLDGSICTGDPSGYGPFDYSKRHMIRAYHLDIVEGAHFTPKIENLIGSPLGDLDYTLRAWPNHHRALLSIIRFQLQIKNKLRRVKKLKTPPECYLQRAINFSPKDAVTYSIYGYYLRKMGALKDAEEKYQKALKIDPDNAKFEYSYSLLLIDLKQYDKALKYAKLAYQHGKPPKGLKKKLKKLKIWKD